MEKIIHFEDDQNVIVKTDADKEGVRLLSVDHVDGSPTDFCGHLVGMLFYDEEGVERAVRAAQKSKNGDLDLLDRVVLTQEAYLKWSEAAAESLKRIQIEAVKRKLKAHEFQEAVESIEDERAEILDGARLKIYVDLPFALGEVAVTLEKKDWAWAGGLMAH